MAGQATKFPWAPIKSPKETESDDGVHYKTHSTLPSSANKTNKGSGGPSSKGM